MGPMHDSKANVPGICVAVADMLRCISFDRTLIVGIKLLVFA
jgi:hypothetical protein